MSSPCINRASWRLLIFLIGSTLLSGLSQTANAAGMTRLQAIDIAVQHNKDLQAARYTVEQARAFAAGRAAA